MIDVGEMTTWLHGALTAAFAADTAVPGVLVGDGVAPEAGGWSKGQPNDTAGVFVPYLVLGYGAPVVSQSANTPLCDTTATLLAISYVLTSFTHDRASADQLAARSRAHVKALTTLGVGAGDLSLRGAALFVDSVRGAVRTDQTFPAMWSATSNLRLNVARTRS